MKKSIIFLYIIAATLILAGFVVRFKHIDTGNITGRMISVTGFVIYVITKYFIARRKN
jgi:hypothetical protein